MINYEEELKKFHPSLDVNEAEDAIYKRDFTDVTDILKEMIQEEKNKSLRSMQSEIQNLVVAAASKVVGDQVSPEHSQKLYDDFIAEMGETK